MDWICLIGVNKRIYASALKKYWNSEIQTPKNITINCFVFFSTHDSYGFFFILFVVFFILNNMNEFIFLFLKKPASMIFRVLSVEVIKSNDSCPVISC